VRRILVMLIVLALAALAGAAGWQALELDRELDELGSPAAAAESGGDALPATRTELLSARRVPEWLQTPTADALLAAQLAEVVTTFAVDAGTRGVSPLWA